MAAGIYIGGIVGGSYFKPLNPNGGTLIGPANLSKTDNALTNCYSYVNLPVQTEDIKALYVLGGTGEINPPGTNDNKANHGICTITNSYYLESVKPQTTMEIKTDVNGTAGVTAVTYAQLAGSDAIKSSQTIYALLTAFSPVTTSEGAGKYSCPSAAYLQGTDYPFPTILTRDNGQYHVNYGNWPLNGIKRDLGSAPIILDLFTREKDEGELAPHTETLELSAGVNTGGAWSVTVAPVNTGEHDENDAPITKEIVTATCVNGVLTVTGTGVGTTTLTVTYAVDSVTYTLPLSVNVTAMLELRTADTVKLFSNDKVSLELKPCGKDSKPLENLEELKGLGLEVEVSVGQNNALESAEVDDFTLNLDSGSESGNTSINYTFIYTYNGETYTGTGATINFQVVEPEIKTETDEEGTVITRTVTFTGGEITAAKVTNGLDDGESQSE